MENRKLKIGHITKYQNPMGKPIPVIKIAKPKDEKKITMTNDFQILLNMKYKLALLLVTVLLSSCAVKQPEKKENIITVKNSFDDKAVSWFKNKGTGNIKGTAKFKSKNGELRFGEEFGIELMPYCLYTEERLDKIYNNKKSGFIYLEDGFPKFIPDPQGYHDTIKTKCDKEGNFEFNNLPSGEYYVIAFMIWENQSVKTGGGLMKKIKLSEGEFKAIEMDNF